MLCRCMLFKSAEADCIIQILHLLSSGKSKYNTMFKETKKSHITLQNVLKYLIKKRFINRVETEYKIVDYQITPRGRTLLEKLEDLKLIKKIKTKSFFQSGLCFFNAFSLSHHIWDL